MNEGPKVSVLLPVYNAQDYLDQAIRSILNQSYTNFELVIVNDGSTDDSLELIQRYESLDDRIVLLSKKNSGIVDALNEGLNVAKGEYIARMDSDDISYQDRLDKQVKVFVEQPGVDLVYSGTTLIDKNGDIVCPSWRPNLERTLKNLEINNFIPHPTVMFSKETVLDIGGYTKNKEHAEDLDLWVRMRDSGRGAVFRRTVTFLQIKPELHSSKQPPCGIRSLRAA